MNLSFQPGSAAFAVGRAPELSAKQEVQGCTGCSGRSGPNTSLASLTWIRSGQSVSHIYASRDVTLLYCFTASLILEIGSSMKVVKVYVFRS